MYLAYFYVAAAFLGTAIGPRAALTRLIALVVASLARELRHQIRNELLSSIDIVSAAAVRSENPEVRVALVDVVELLERHADAGGSQQIRTCIGGDMKKSLPNNKLSAQTWRATLLRRAPKLRPVRFWL
ncbi:hypothetical protein PMN64_25745 [Bradyrhizobium sp. UFLA01-814]|uniref:hypothetical protein n=1 Tax=Bradyrhizobium sp. UFLA01-814 TaxID=3023480 RepID=UPI00398BA689